MVFHKNISENFLTNALIVFPQKISNDAQTPTRIKHKKYIFEDVIKVPSKAFDDTMKMIFKYQVFSYSFYYKCIIFGLHHLI